MITKRRWLKSIIAAAQEPQPALPFQRQNRIRPAAFKSVEVPAPGPKLIAAE